ncbi:Oidioi.mRNA.OKI2018_I69.chr2.g5397.t1.cds [Oikopleura dioica]|uniref:Oidioi.mRNA.OKI2018_I69.chr2.g5397.t1.cds n=1 Tax=Oikopleura dioica TaxID=34765 RepID=A0ABN7T0Q8_OIKDI|nr:Oidioi.mRNA.OKI2018_I69.chr2.g5397.t1.cds [Oikopleura dioica]
MPKQQKKSFQEICLELDLQTLKEYAEGRRDGERVPRGKMRAAQAELAVRMMCKQERIEETEPYSPYYTDKRTWSKQPSPNFDKRLEEMTHNEREQLMEPYRDAAATIRNLQRPEIFRKDDDPLEQLANDHHYIKMVHDHAAFSKW